jgi:hypothetical protein
VSEVELLVGCLDDFLPRRDVPMLVAEPYMLPAIVTNRLLLLLLRWRQLLAALSGIGCFQ